MRGNFESKYGSPTSPDAQVLIGMRGGKAVYGSELDAADTSGKNVINNTYSQNQAIMGDMFKGMKQSGGMYNPSPTAIAKVDQMYPPTAADSTVTTRADGKQMIGANSTEGANMREKTSTNNQFADTMARLTKPAQQAQSTQQAQTIIGASPQANPMMGILNPAGDAGDTEEPSTIFSGDSSGYLLDILNKQRRRKQGSLPNDIGI